jgi:multidrug efflux pump subunit AcrA (membrane-fusion protein)
MFVKVNLHTDPREPVLSIPEQAVRPGNQIWVVRDGKLHIESLPVAQIVGGEVLVPPQNAPVKPGDRIVISPLPAPTPKMEVREEAIEAAAYAATSGEPGRS